MYVVFHNKIDSGPMSTRYHLDTIECAIDCFAARIVCKLNCLPKVKEIRMAPKNAPKCIECRKTESLLWRQLDNEGGLMCQDCYELKNKDRIQEIDAAVDLAKGNATKDAKDTVESKVCSTMEEKKLRKSTRATRFKTKTVGTGNVISTVSNGGSTHNITSNAKLQSKGRNRRNIFKKTPLRISTSQATTRVVDSLFFQESYLQVGDIVSLADSDYNIYYAQIRGLLIDNYCEKSAFLTWLIPTQASPDPREGFDAATYLVGPDEELSRKLSSMEFVMHAPSNYYYDRTTPFPLPDIMECNSKSGGYIWTTLPEYRRKNNLS